MWQILDTALSYKPKTIEPSTLSDSFALESSAYRTASAVLSVSLVTIKVCFVFTIFSLLAVR
jgi:hypothetical protein